MYDRQSIKSRLSPLFSCCTARPLFSGLLALLFIGLAVNPVQAKQYGLVVGIDGYLHGRDIDQVGTVRNLQGAENDAKLIAREMRNREIDLPDNRLLLGKNATRHNFLEAWKSVKKKAVTGDTIYVTFAGHGGQVEEVREPFDESNGDNHDESLMFYDFDPDNPLQGSLLDDELYELFKEVQGPNIVFVADSCHSGGLTRSVARKTISRNGGRWQVDLSDLDGPPSIATEGEDWESLNHVTYLTATEDESKKVDEIMFDDKPHGALSVSFAEGLSGKADRDGNGQVFRFELEQYLTQRIATFSNQRQTPGFLPRSLKLDTPIMDFSAFNHLLPTMACSENDMLEPILVSGTRSQKLQNVRQANQAALHFETDGSNTRVFYEQDHVGSVSTASEQQNIVDKYRLLRTIDNCQNSTRAIPRIEFDCSQSAHGRSCNDVHSIAESSTYNERGRIYFKFGQNNHDLGDYFVLFNLAGNGELQWLYPLAAYKDNPRLERNSLPYDLEIKINEPAGRDDFVAGFCDKDPAKLSDALKRNKADITRFTDQSEQLGCQWGRSSLFTVE